MSSKTILVIEDEKPLRLALKDKLREAGYTVLQAQDGEEGLRVALKDQPDLILLDLLMPKMGGQEMLGKLREGEWGKTVPVVILTNSNDNDTIYETLKLSAQDYFIKAETSLAHIVDDIVTRIGPADS